MVNLDKMIKIEEYNQYISIFGIKNVNIVNTDKFLIDFKRMSLSSSIQIFDADCIAGKEHLFFAILNAFKAYSQGINRSKTIEMEILLYASCQRQISKALKMIGVKKETKKIAVVILASTKDEIERTEERIFKNLPVVRDDEIIKTKNNLQNLTNLYEISNLELETMESIKESRESIVAKLIIENSALLVLD